MEPQDALAQFLHSIPLFEYVGREELMELLRLVRPIELAAGEVLFHQGEVGSAMWVLGPGCEVQLTVGQGSESRTLAGLTVGDTLGEMSLIDDAPRSATAVVLQGGGAYRIEASDFDVLRDQQRPCAFHLLRKMATDMCLRLRMVSVQIVPEGVGQPEPASPRPEGERLHASTLEEFAPLRDTPATARLALAQKLTERTLQPGELVCREGEPGDAIFMLVEGEVETRRHGTPYLTLGPGSLVGLVSTLDGGNRSASVVARSTARVWRLGASDFERLFQAGNRFAYRLVELVARQLAANLRQANSTLVARTASPDEPGLTASALGEIDFNLSL